MNERMIMSDDTKDLIAVVLALCVGTVFFFLGLCAMFNIPIW